MCMFTHTFTQRLFRYDGCVEFLTSLQRLGSPKAPVPPQVSRSPQPQAQSAWLAPASWASGHWSAGLSSVASGFLFMESNSHVNGLNPASVPSKLYFYFIFFTFWSVSVSEGTDNLPDAILGADAIRPHVSPLYNLCCDDVCVCGF